MKLIKTPVAPHQKQKEEINLQSPSVADVDALTCCHHAKKGINLKPSSIMALMPRHAVDAQADHFALDITGAKIK